MLEVVAALICREDRYLICRRPMRKARGGKWEFPGGKVEAGETGQETITREIQEELAVCLYARGVAAETVYAYPDLTVHLTLIEAEICQGEITPLEHSEIAWATLDEIKQYDLCPADRLLVEQLK